MFQALGVHGPELSPTGAALLDVVLVGTAFAFLFSAPRANRMTAAMLATMVLAMAAVRVVMQPLPNIQPVTVAALLVGAHLGAKRGVAFAILVTLLSNLLISHGWWTLFQALGWSAVAVVGAKANLIADGRLNHARLYLAAVLVAPLFGLISTLSLVSGTMSVGQFVILVVQGLPFDAVHALGNVAFAVWTGSMLHRFLSGLTALEDDVLATGELHGLDA
ncbi:MAG: DUF6580 family putative transport protein [Poseidonia sp.]